jgi:hypothetical protein
MFVARAESDRAVSMVIMLAKRTIRIVRGSPIFPSTHPKRRYMTTPKIVRTLGV